jgi:hypothetical protein
VAVVTRAELDELSPQAEADLRSQIRAAGYVVGKLWRYLPPIDSDSSPEVLFVGYERRAGDCSGARPLTAYLPVRTDESLTVLDGW